MSLTAITLIDRTETLLEHWGRWCRSREVSALGYRSKAVFIVEVSKGASSAMSDDDALIIDRVVATLRKRQPEFYKVIELSFRYNHNFTQIAKRLNVNRNMARHYHDCGVAWVDGRLEQLREKLAA